MKGNCGDILKVIMKEYDLNQREMAEIMLLEPRQMSRIISGAQELDLVHLLELVQNIGMPTEDLWVLFLETDEYKGYRIYRKIKRLIRDRKMDELAIVFAEFLETPLAEHKAMRQFVAYVQVELDTHSPPEEVEGNIMAALRIRNPDFDVDKVALYRLNYNEICLLICLADQYEKLGNRSKAIALTKAMIDSREYIKATEEDKAHLYPALLFNLATLVGTDKRYKEALKHCDTAIEICREYNNLIYAPDILFLMVKCYFGLKEDEDIYRAFLIRAYYTALGHGNREFAMEIKSDAAKYLGITDIRY